MQDTRLTNEELDLVVSFAYGGGAYQAGRRAQARTINRLLRGEPLNGDREQPRASERS